MHDRPVPLTELQTLDINCQNMWHIKVIFKIEYLECRERKTPHEMNAGMSFIFLLERSLSQGVKTFCLNAKWYQYNDSDHWSMVVQLSNIFVLVLYLELPTHAPKPRSMPIIKLTFCTLWHLASEHLGGSCLLSLFISVHLLCSILPAIPITHTSYKITSP